MKSRTKTKAVLGYKLTLNAGERYLVIRPMVGCGVHKREGEFPVMIQTHNNPLGEPRGLRGRHDPDDKANDFLNAFNNGKYTFDGRIW